MIPRTINGTHTKEHKAWMHIRQRVKNANSYAYGLDIDFKDFDDFYNHVGPCPDPSYSIDRIDNTKGYLVGNVRWADKLTQNRNRNSVMIVNTPDGEMSLKAACRYYGLKYTTVRYNYINGKTINWRKS